MKLSLASLFTLTALFAPLLFWASVVSRYSWHGILPGCLVVGLGAGSGPLFLLGKSELECSPDQLGAMNVGMTILCYVVTGAAMVTVVSARSYYPSAEADYAAGFSFLIAAIGMNALAGWAIGLRGQQR